MSLKRREKRAQGSSTGGHGAAWLLGCACLVAPGALAQQPAATPASPPPSSPSSPSGEPTLHQRSAQQPDAVPVPVVATGHATLPPEAEGEYPWDKGGGEIELYFEDGKLHGYMTEHMDPNQHAAAVTFEFATTHADGHAVEWTTRVVHGTFYSFTGHLERGLAANPGLPGYYLLAGTLTEHGGDTDGLVRTVSLKREPGTP